MDRSADWWRQAERDLEQARWSAQGGFCEHACFACHGAAEKPVKALHHAQKREVGGHAIGRLLDALAPAVEVPDTVAAAAWVLDRHYIPARYPNGFSEGAPADFYRVAEAEEAIRHAGQILAFCQQHLPGLGGDSQGPA